MSFQPEFAGPSIDYPGFDLLPQLPGFTVEVDDSIVLEGSEAYTGVRVKDAPQVMEYEIFYQASRRGEFFELYPLNGQDEPFEFRIDGHFIGSDEQAIASVAKLALHTKAQQLQ